MREKSSKRRFFWLGGLAVVLLIGAGLFWTWVRDCFSPDQTLTTFCQALVTQDYPTAYSHLSQYYQERLSYSDFVAEYSSNNGVGHVTACQEHVYDDSIIGNYGKIDLTYANGTKGQQEFRLTTDDVFLWKLLPGSV